MGRGNFLRQSPSLPGITAAADRTGHARGEFREWWHGSGAYQMASTASSAWDGGCDVCFFQTSLEGSSWVASQALSRARLLLPPPLLSLAQKPPAKPTEEESVLGQRASASCEILQAECRGERPRIIKRRLRLRMHRLYSP